MKTTIRAFKESDADIVFALMKEKAELDGISDELGANLNGLSQQILDPSNNVRVIVAADKDASVVGIASYTVLWSIYAAQRYIWLEDIYVSPTSRKQGIAKSLFRHICREAVLNNVQRIDWVVASDNQGAKDFYHRLGAIIYTEYNFARLSGSDMSFVAQSESSDGN